MKKSDLISRISRWVLGILGFASLSSCDTINGIIGGGGGGMECMYGMPTMEYQISGKVQDAEKQPIKGIRVTVPDSYNYPADTVLTATDGSFSLKGSYFDRADVAVKFEDVDGADNGGLFKEKTDTITTKQIKKGSGAWDGGTYGADNVVVTLERE